MTSKHLLAVPALRATVEAALDAGVFYQSAFQEFCRPNWDVSYPAVEHRLPDVLITPAMAFATKRALTDAAKEAVLTGARGTWVCCVKQHEVGGKHYYETFMHDGAGTVHARNDGYGAKPTYEEVLTRMVGMEIYTARHAVEKERQDARAAGRASQMGLHLGMTLRNVTVGHDRYSNVVIEEFHPESGSLRLLCTKRGSRNRWVCHTTALNLTIEKAGESSPSGADMFSVAA